MKTSGVYLWVKVIILVIAPILFQNCGTVRQLESIVGRTNSILNDGINQLTATSDNWQSIMQSAISQLPIWEFKLKRDLQEILNTAIQLAGQEYRCSAQYTADMLIFNLKTILARRTLVPPPQPNPQICTPDPFYIDLNLPAESRKTLKLSGYFFDFANDLKVYHVLQSNQRIDVSQCLTGKTNYMLTLDLTNVPLNNNSKSLAIYNRDIMLSMVSVIQQIPPDCIKMPQTLTFSKIVLIPEHKVACCCNGVTEIGDADFDGNGPCMRGYIRIYLQNYNTEIHYTAFVKAWECPDRNFHKCREDYTYGDIIQSGTLYQCQSGWKVNRMLSSTYTNWEFADSDHETNYVNWQAPISMLEIVGDIHGDDVIGNTKVTITLSNFRVELIQTGNCTPR